MYFSSILFSILLSLTGVTSISDVASTPPPKTYNLSGKLFKTYRYQGGMNSPDLRIPEISPGKTLLVVEYKGENELPKVVDSIRSDVNGRFTIALPPGKYAFVDPNDSIVAGQVLPAAIQKGGLADRYTSFWEANVTVPVAIVDRDIIAVYLTQHETFSCGICP